MPEHHTLEEYLDVYIRAAGLENDRKGPLFRTSSRTGYRLTGSPMLPADVWRMIRRRADKAGIKTKIGCHSFRSTGMTNYLQHGGTLEKTPPQCISSRSLPRLIATH